MRTGSAGLGRGASGCPRHQTPAASRAGCRGHPRSSTGRNDSAHPPASFPRSDGAKPATRGRGAQGRRQHAAAESRAASAGLYKVARNFCSAKQQRWPRCAPAQRRWVSRNAAEPREGAVPSQEGPALALRYSNGNASSGGGEDAPPGDTRRVAGRRRRSTPRPQPTPRR